MNAAEFKEKIRVDKCDGEITEEKLIKFIRNFNQSGRMTKVVFEGDEILIINLFGETKVKYSIDGLLSAMMYIMSGGGV